MALAYTVTNKVDSPRSATASRVHGPSFGWLRPTGAVDSEDCSVFGGDVVEAGQEW